LPPNGGEVSDYGPKRSVEDRRDHLMSCEPCWLDWAKLTLRIGAQIEEREYYAAAGLPFAARSGGLA
jgi:hypothetical protein